MAQLPDSKSTRMARTSPSSESSGQVCIENHDTSARRMKGLPLRSQDGVIHMKDEKIDGKKNRAFQKAE